MVTIEAVGIGAVMTVAALLLYRGFEVGKVSIVSPLTSTYPAISTVLAVFILGESMSLERGIGITLTLLGIVVVSMKRGEETQRTVKKAGVLYGLGAMVTMGFVYFALKLVVIDLGPWWPVFFFRFVAIGAVAPLVATLHRRGVKVTGPLSVLPILALIAAVFDTVANVSYNLGITQGEVSVVSTVSGLYSVVTVMLMITILKERLLLHQSLGVLALLAGIGLLGYYS